MRLIVMTVSAAAAIGLGGCSKSLDAGALEEDIVDMYHLVSAECPDDIEPKAGVNFSCIAVAEDGERLEVNVEQLNSDGNVKLSLVDGTAG